MPNEVPRGRGRERPIEGSKCRQGASPRLCCGWVAGEQGMSCRAQLGEQDAEREQRAVLCKWLCTNRPVLASLHAMRPQVAFVSGACLPACTHWYPGYLSSDAVGRTWLTTRATEAHKSHVGLTGSECSDLRPAGCMCPHRPSVSPANAFGVPPLQSQDRRREDC